MLHGLVSISINPWTEHPRDLEAFMIWTNWTRPQDCGTTVDEALKGTENREKLTDLRALGSAAAKDGANLKAVGNDSGARLETRVAKTRGREDGLRIHGHLFPRDPAESDLRSNADGIPLAIQMTTPSVVIEALHSS